VSEEVLDKENSNLSTHIIEDTIKKTRNSIVKNVILLDQGTIVSDARVD
jgi:hypothetical protein